MNIKKRNNILEAAEKLFNRFGIKKTAVDDIAALANVAKGTIYNNFGSKEGILHELLNDKINIFEKSINRSLQSLKDPFECIKAVLIERINILLNNPFISDALLRLDDINLHRLSGDLDKSIRLFLAKILDKDNFQVPDQERNHIIDTFLYTLRGMEETVKEKFGHVSMDRMEKDLDYMIQRFLPGLHLNNK